MLGADSTAGESNLTYTWSTTGTPPAAVNFSANGSNAAKNTTATFSTAGNYSFQVTITDPSGLTATSSVNVTVNQTLTAITVSPRVASAARRRHAAVHGHGQGPIRRGPGTQPTFTWAVASGIGSINGTGLYTAPGGTGSASIEATSGAISGTASVVVNHITLTLPGPQSAGSGTLVFSLATGNQIAVQDVGAGTAPIEVTLSANFGQITLAGVQNLTQVTGNGTSSIAMRGSLGAVNTAMNGMQFRPAAPSATLQVTVNNLGTGGPQTASGAIAITAPLPDPDNNNNNNINNNNNNNNNATTTTTDNTNGTTGPMTGGTTGPQTPSTTPDKPTDNGSTKNNHAPGRLESNPGSLSVASRYFVQAARSDDDSSIMAAFPSVVPAPAEWRQRNGIGSGEANAVHWRQPRQCERGRGNRCAGRHKRYAGSLGST